jgi:hypothetical protein
MVLPFVFGITRKDNSEIEFPGRNKGNKQNTNTQPQTCVVAKGRVYRVAGVWTIPRTTQKVAIYGVWRQIAETGPPGRVFCFPFADSKAWPSG